LVLAGIGGLLIYKFKVKGKGKGKGNEKKKSALKIRPSKLGNKSPDVLSATSSLQIDSTLRQVEDTPRNALIDKVAPPSREQKRRSQMLRLGSLTDANNNNLMANAESIGSLGALEEINKLKKAKGIDKSETPLGTTRTVGPLMEVIPEHPLTTTRQMSIDNDVDIEYEDTVHDQ